mmetsp:Transcript_10440/g.32381  ORF Transcript_10440/g.32381 Transcript_10440/m.32381 type:complete len:207 (-) Transcript_10440:20-640(-)
MDLVVHLLFAREELIDLALRDGLVVAREDGLRRLLLEEGAEDGVLLLRLDNGVLVPLLVRVERCLRLLPPLLQHRAVVAQPPHELPVFGVGVGRERPAVVGVGRVGLCRAAVGEVFRELPLVGEVGGDERLAVIVQLRHLGQQHRPLLLLGALGDLPHVVHAVGAHRGLLKLELPPPVLAVPGLDDGRGEVLALFLVDVGHPPTSQ